MKFLVITNKAELNACKTRQPCPVKGGCGCYSSTGGYRM